MKLFVRRDLFDRIIAGGFVNLTRINARKIEIEWSEDDLWDLLHRRLRENHEFLEMVGAGNASPAQIFAALFPEKVDSGSRKPWTWSWMMRRIRDGQDVRPPRNLIDLVKKSQQAQVRREERNHLEYVAGRSIISSESVKDGLRALSDERVQDTLLAEAGDLQPYVVAFRGGKVEHNAQSLAETLRLSGEELDEVVQKLVSLGFLEKLTATYKVPSLYRNGLGITQGKAFGASGTVEDEDED